MKSVSVDRFEKGSLARLGLLPRVLSSSFRFASPRDAGECRRAFLFEVESRIPERIRRQEFRESPEGFPRFSY